MEHKLPDLTQSLQTDLQAGRVILKMVSSFHEVNESYVEF